MLKNVNDNEIAFIVCTNHRGYMDECRYYIDQLRKPKGTTVSIIEIHDPQSMTKGYNEGMNRSGARYKVYLHQDVFIINRNFIYDILKCFAIDDSLGLIGVAGTDHLADADIWSSLNVGGCYSTGTFEGYGYVTVRPKIRPLMKSYQEVEYVDGMLIATQHDIEWDERIEGFHFYDISQCERFRKAGWKVAVAEQKEAWTFHDFGPLNLQTYRENQRKFCSLYAYQVSDETDNNRIYRGCEKVASSLKKAFSAGDFNLIRTSLRDIDNAIYFDQDLLTMFFIMETDALEDAIGDRVLLRGFQQDRNMYELIEERWLRLKMDLIRAFFGYRSMDDIAGMIINGLYSIPTVIVSALHHVPNDDVTRILCQISERLIDKRVITEDGWQKLIAMVRDYEERKLPATNEIG